jgi:hypothetical protein
VSIRTYVKCSNEHQQCSCTGMVRYGDPVSNTWSTEEIVSGSILCSTSVFGDPISGVAKICQCHSGSSEIAAGLPLLVNGTLRSMGSASPGNIEMMVVGGNVPWSVAEVVFYYI